MKKTKTKRPRVSRGCRAKRIDTKRQKNRPDGLFLALFQACYIYVRHESGSGRVSENGRLKQVCNFFRKISIQENSVIAVHDGNDSQTISRGIKHYPRWHIREFRIHVVDALHDTTKKWVVKADYYSATMADILATVEDELLGCKTRAWTAHSTGFVALYGGRSHSMSTFLSAIGFDKDCTIFFVRPSSVRR